MKKRFLPWAYRLIAFSVLSLFIIILAVVNPSFLYAKKSNIGNFTVYHNSNLHPNFEKSLNRINTILKESELNDSSQDFKICLNDGSSYPNLIQTLMGPAFGYGFKNIMALQGKLDCDEYVVELNGYKWNMEQLIAHELTHCMQYNTLGLFKSNPLGNHPMWKWEGYAEYVSRQGSDQLSLTKNIERYENSIKENPEAWAIYFEDGTVSPKEYYEYWLLVQYCLDVKAMSYIDLLNSDYSQTTVKKDMINWYHEKVIN